MAKVYFDQVHLTQFYKEKFGYRGGELPVTETFSQQVLTLSMYPALTEDEMDYIANMVANFFSQGKNG